MILSISLKTLKISWKVFKNVKILDVQLGSDLNWKSVGMVVMIIIKNTTLFITLGMSSKTFCKVELLKELLLMSVVLCYTRQLSIMQESWCTITKLSELDPKWSLLMETIILRPDNLHLGKVKEVWEISNFHKLSKTLQGKHKSLSESLSFNLMIPQWHTKFVRKVGFQTILWSMLHSMVHKFLLTPLLLTVCVENSKERYKWFQNSPTDTEELTAMSTKEVSSEIVHILMDAVCFLKMEK